MIDGLFLNTNKSDSHDSKKEISCFAKKLNSSIDGTCCNDNHCKGYPWRRYC